MRLYTAYVPFILQLMAWPPSWLYFSLRGGLRVCGREHLQGLPSAVIFAANHTAHIDPILVRGALPWLATQAPMFYVARQRKEYGWRGWRALLYTDLFFRAWGAYPAYRGTHNYAHSLKHFVRILHAGHPVTIFPKGMNRHPEYSNQKEVRGGVGYLALHTGVPVVPVAILTEPRARTDARAPTHRTTVLFGKPLYFNTALGASQEPSVQACKETAQTIWSAIEKEQKHLHEVCVGQSVTP